MRRARRYFISLNLKPHPFHLIKNEAGYYCYYYNRVVWPKLFDSYEEARAFAMACNPLNNREAIPGRGKIVSWTIDSVVDPRIAALKVKVDLNL